MILSFEQRAAELRKGSSLNEYCTCPHYARATRRGRVHWIVLKAGWLDCWLEGDEDLGERGMRRVWARMGTSGTRWAEREPCGAFGAPVALLLIWRSGRN